MYFFYFFHTIPQSNLSGIVHILISWTMVNYVVCHVCVVRLTHENMPNNMPYSSMSLIEPNKQKTSFGPATTKPWKTTTMTTRSQWSIGLDYISWSSILSSTFLRGSDTGADWSSRDFEMHRKRANDDYIQSGNIWNTNESNEYCFSVVWYVAQSSDIKLRISLHTHIYIYIWIYMCVCIYIYLSMLCILLLPQCTGGLQESPLCKHPWRC